MSALRSLSTPNWLRIELACLAAVHIVLGGIVALGDQALVVTTGSRPVFEIWPSVLSVSDLRWLWGYVFVIGGALFLWTASRQRIGRMIAAEIAVGFGHGTWSVSLFIAVLDGRGSAIGTVLFPALLLWCGFAGIRVWLSSGE